MYCPIILPFFLQYLSNAEDAIGSWSVTSKSTLTKYLNTGDLKRKTGMKEANEAGNGRSHITRNFVIYTVYLVLLLYSKQRSQLSCHVVRMRETINIRGIWLESSHTTASLCTGTLMDYTEIGNCKVDWM